MADLPKGITADVSAMESVGINIDWSTLAQAVHAVASQALLEGVKHARDGTPVDNAAIQERVLEALKLFRSELATAHMETN